MRILVIGGGGREHAIIWKLSQSKRNPELYCAPGNAGIAKLARCVPLTATDLDGIIEFSKNEGIDLVFVAPDDPLAMGLVNKLLENGITAFGPTAQAAEIEASKSFSKRLMKKYGIPTAEYEVFTEVETAKEYISKLTPPIVIKADGLALGKGVIISETLEDAYESVSMMMSGSAFGESGKTVLVEEYLRGRELTVLAFTDGYSVKTMPPSRDHKKALDGDKGLNTGGMGAICPVSGIDRVMEERMREEIFLPTIKAMRKEGRPFEGVIYFGLMLTDDGPKVIEYNARFGDPETQAVLPLLKTDLLEIVEAVISHRLDKIRIEWSEKSSCCVVLASGGYPSGYETGKIISGLDVEDDIIFHAGTRYDKDGVIVTSGGRVLGITALGDSSEEAMIKAYEKVAGIKFENMHFRRDIGRS
ncbi:MAG: phosphoribosylamine--glycine ligase [Eubacteriales bacterium]|jgi:phosphoribosylamine--glycine ligase|nr:phosphoribosylamine--glycine ligase [Eubacteriales bacterium]MDD4328098.1 phosphoribosylamine--glycine ligase [Eubacteriales bacterium]MDD4717353.1 phosphoribosylamine--glycine ligase [Eubacteriales bacterium]